MPGRWSWVAHALGLVAVAAVLGQFFLLDAVPLDEKIAFGLFTGFVLVTSLLVWRQYGPSAGRTPA